MSYRVIIEYVCARCGKQHRDDLGPILHVTLPYQPSHTHTVFTGGGAPLWYCSDTCLTFTRTLDNGVVGG